MKRAQNWSWGNLDKRNPHRAHEPGAQELQSSADAITNPQEGQYAKGCWADELRAALCEGELCDRDERGVTLLQKALHTENHHRKTFMQLYLYYVIANI